MVSIQHMAMTRQCLLLNKESARQILWFYLHIKYMHIDNEVTQIRVKVRKAAKIRNRYNQVPHLTQDTTWESDKTHLNTTHKSQEVSPFQAGDHKAAMDRRESMTNARHK